MTKKTLLSLGMSMAIASAAMAATDEEECQRKKLIALGKRELCLEKQRVKEVLGKTSDVAKCKNKFDRAIARANEAAASRGASCRWLELGDGTARDLDTGLQWELKTDDGSIHDKANKYTWSATETAPDGTAFAVFL